MLSLASFDLDDLAVELVAPPASMSACTSAAVVLPALVDRVVQRVELPLISLRTVAETKEALSKQYPNSRIEVRV